MDILDVIIGFVMVSELAPENRTTPERGKVDPVLETHKKKLVGFYLSGGDSRFIFDSDQREFSEARIDERAKDLALKKIQNDERSCRDMERRLLDTIAKSRREMSADEIYDRMKGDKHQKKILAYMTDVAWDNLKDVSGDNVATFLNNYPNPMDFAKESEVFLDKIREVNSIGKYYEYVESMEDFCAQMYGKKYEYFKAIQDLHREVDARREKQERQRKIGRMAGKMVFERDRKIEKVVADAGVVTLNKGELIGRASRRNEDALYADTESGVFGVFDGAGGERGGAAASSAAVRALSEEAARKPLATVEDLARAIHAINAAVCNDPRAGISTGVVGRILERDGRKKMIYASVGDSRIYLVRRNKALRLTRDEGYGNVIENFLGDEEMYLDQIREIDLQRGDRIVFCSDGITGDFEKDFIPDDELGFMVGRAKNAEAAANDLIRRATKIDDRTAVVVEV